jgi:glycosyltransferase involved in cell wall biosynthesis
MEAERPLISVITVCYQAEEFLEQCIQSVIAQDCHDFEYILIDGGSSDGTVRIIEKYQDRLAYWHSKPDRGLSHAFNQGLEQSRGEWLAFLNSDDRYASPSVLSNLANVLREEKNADVVHGRIQHIKRQSEPVPQSKEIGRTWSWNRFRRYSTIPHPAAFINRRLIDQVGKFDEDFRNALDYELFLRKGPELVVRYVPELVAQMRIGGISTDGVERSLRESRDAQIKNRANGIGLAYFWWGYFSLRAMAKRTLFAQNDD